MCLPGPSPYCSVLPGDSEWPAWSVEGREGLSQHWGPSEPFPLPLLGPGNLTWVSLSLGL